MLCPIGYVICFAEYYASYFSAENGFLFLVFFSAPADQVSMHLVGMKFPSKRLPKIQIVPLHFPRFHEQWLFEPGCLSQRKGWHNPTWWLKARNAHADSLDKGNFWSELAIWKNLEPWQLDHRSTIEPWLLPQEGGGAFGEGVTLKPIS